MRIVPRPGELLAIRLPFIPTEEQLIAMQSTIRHWRGYSSQPVLILHPGVELVVIQGDESANAAIQQQSAAYDAHVENQKAAIAKASAMQRELAADYRPEHH